MGTTTLSGKMTFHLGRGEMVFNGSPNTFKALLMMDGFTFDPVTMDALSDITEAAWDATTVYAEGDIVIPATPNGHKYQIDTGGGGTSAASEPTFPTTSGGTVTDGTCTWTEIGNDDQAPTANGYTQNNKILVVESYVNDATTKKTTVSFSDPSWVAEGGYLGSVDGSAVEIAGILIINSTPVDPIILSYHGFTSSGYTADGKGLSGVGIAIELDGQ